MRTPRKHKRLFYLVILNAFIWSMLVAYSWSAELDHFIQYSYPEEGFEVAFPQKPLTFRTDRGSEQGYVNSYQAILVNPVSQYSVFVNHSPLRVFEEESIDAYLKGLVSGIMKVSDDAVLKYSERTMFRGFPALDYKYEHKIEGTPVIGRGKVFVIDGQHIRLSQIHTIDDTTSDGNYSRFINSFKLTSIDVPLSDQRFEDRLRNISFYPPNGWQRRTPKFAQVVAIYSNPSGHSVTVLDSGTTGYTCDNYKNESQSTQDNRTAGDILLQGRMMNWFKFTAHNPSAGIRMTSVHYCLNTLKGAVIMIGAAPEQTFFRSEIIFRKVASSMIIRK